MTIGDGIAIAGVAMSLAFMFACVIIARIHAAELMMRNKKDDT